MNKLNVFRNFMRISNMVGAFSHPVRTIKEAATTVTISKSCKKCHVRPVTITSLQLRYYEATKNKKPQKCLKCR